MCSKAYVEDIVQISTLSSIKDMNSRAKQGMLIDIPQGFEPQINKFNEEDEVRKFKNENSLFGISGHNLNKVISAQT